MARRDSIVPMGAAIISRVIWLSSRFPLDCRQLKARTEPNALWTWVTLTDC